MHSTQDLLGRPLGSLRISVTDRCNLRCAYCMPEREYVWLPRSDLLDFAEIESVAATFAAAGVRKLRLTGGEPTLRKDLPRLIERLTRIPGIEDVALTTNGVLLAEQAAPLAAAGLRRVTVSLDTLRPERFRALAGRDQLAAVLAGLEAARAAGLAPLKLNTVVMRGRNDDELLDLLAFGARGAAEVRFIEYMDVGGATRWASSEVVGRAEILSRIAAVHGPAEPAGPPGPAPAERFRLRDGTTFGIIASTTAPFCGTCDRARLTADGMLYLCLYAKDGVDLRRLLRSGAGTADLLAAVRAAWTGRKDRGAEERLGLLGRRPLHRSTDLQLDPHLEMHTRGG